jgi:hypothetical protein
MAIDRALAMTGNEIGKGFAVLCPAVPEEDLMQLVLMVLVFLVSLAGVGQRS